MDKKTTSWVSYLTIIGWLVAYLAGDKEGARFYLNQSLLVWIGYIILMIASRFLLFIPIIGWLAIYAGYVFLFVIWIMGLISAVNQEEKELPLIGQIKILN